MRNLYVIIAVLWAVSALAYAQEEVLMNEVSKDNETYSFTGQVVDKFGDPISDVLVKSLSTNISMTTGNDGLYSYNLPVPNDSVVFIKNGEKLCSGLLSSYNKFYLILDSTECSLLPYNKAIEKMAKTHYEVGLQHLNMNSKNAPENTKAFEHIRRAAQMENPDAIYVLAQMYEQGIGVTQNYGEAIFWYNRSNNSNAKTRLGVMYSEGLGVKQNYKDAAYYFYHAFIEDGNETAKEYLKEILAKRVVTRESLKTYKINKNKEEAVLNPMRFPGEKHAVFPGGDRACMNWLFEHIKYPEDCREQGIQGRVLTNFDIDIDGSIINLEVLISPHPSLAKEAIRVINNMPKWKPAEKDGKAVCSHFRLPITFRLK